MEWKKLLSDKTFRERGELKEFDGRDPFENDYGRIISSTFIRRLQDKTQVFPLEESDFIRTRLTHSMEVAAIAKSLGKSVEKVLLDKGKLDKQYKGHISSLLNVAGLVHDLGNPPFGHFGESAIQTFFSRFFSTRDNSKGVVWNDQQMKDFIFFDGNVQTFRILRKLSFLNDEFSYNLTYPTLACIVKYPRSSITGNIKNATNVAEKKFGYFISEEEDYRIISDHLGLNNNRHPAVFLLEAGDDIAYSAADIEDGVKLGSLNFSLIYETFEENLKDDEKKDEVLNALLGMYEKSKIISSDRLDLTVRKFRIFTQGLMIEAAINEFLNNHDDILDGKYSKELISNSSAKNIRAAYKQLGYLVFAQKKIVQAELAGWEIISGLLEIFVEASKSENFKSSGNNVESRLYNMISSSFRYMYETYPSIYPNTNLEYKKILLITDFISGMTDSYALNYYQKLKGIKI